MLKKMLKMSVVVLALSLASAQAAYTLRYEATVPGALTFTGNTIGLNKQNSTNNPGSAGSIGAYIAAEQTGTYSGHPAPTSGDWTLNRSNAILTIPAGATVQYAELIWGGSYAYGGQVRTLAERNGAVSFGRLQGLTSVSPDPATSVDFGALNGGGTACGTDPCRYIRSANVTSLVQALGSGTHTVSLGRIPATIGASENNNNTGGWTLAVAYRDASLPERKMNIYVGSENVQGVNGAVATVSNFCTAPFGAQSGRLLVSALEGDAGITGDSFKFGTTSPPTNNLSGPRNLATNFFASQITGDDGSLATLGSFGMSNQTPGTASQGRQGYDIANVNISSFLAPGQTTAYAQGTSTGDVYTINALGIQIQVGQPSFPTAVKAVDKAVAQVGDELLYTITLDNSTGTATATNVKFFDNVPPGTSFVANSFTHGGTPMPGADPTQAGGVSLPNIVTGGSVVVTFKAKVNTIPARPAPASYINSARWTYDYVPCVGQPVINGEKTTNSVTTTIARLDASKTVAPASGAQAPGSTLTYTIAITNDGLAPSSGATMADAIPAGTTYVAGSTQMNGVAVPDVAGAMPFATAAPVRSAGQAAGVVAVGATATITFQVTIDDSATGTIANSAVVDVDGPGAGSEPPMTTPPTSTPVQLTANVSIAKSNGASSVIKDGDSTYTITVSNAGPSAADGTVVQDPAVTGLNCTAVTCPPAGLTGGAACPASLSISALQGAGLTVPTLPAASSLQLEVICSVTASGV